MSYLCTQILNSFRPLKTTLTHRAVQPGQSDMCDACLRDQPQLNTFHGKITGRDLLFVVVVNT